MHREYQKWFSPALRRNMELLIFGHAGAPLLIFPTSKGRFHEYEDRGMIAANAHLFETGYLQAFCVDSVDEESWYNRHTHPANRVLRHIQYENYLLDEVLPLIGHRSGGQRLTAMGCSFGGYHAANFSFRHPHLVARLISMSGAFDIRSFLSGHYDQNAYFHNPVDFLPQLTDHGRLQQIRAIDIVLGTSDWDICLPENLRLSGILNGKAIPHWLDVWQDHSKHDWPLWHRMVQKYF